MNTTQSVSNRNPGPWRGSDYYEITSDNRVFEKLNPGNQIAAFGDSVLGDFWARQFVDAMDVYRIARMTPWQAAEHFRK